eukprot:scaffold756_cov158-Amphora_coffeaeformis.AAC.2
MSETATEVSTTQTLRTMAATTTSVNATSVDMTHDATETLFGICTYRSPSVAGFSGVLKGRFSDFLVHEVSLEGIKAELTCVDGTIETNPTVAATSKDGDDRNEDRKRKREDCEKKKDTEAKDDQDEEESATNWELMQTELVDLLKHQEDGTGNSKQCANEVLEFLRKPADESRKYVCIPSSTADKHQRRALHEWIRARLSSFALADTGEEQGVKVIRVWNPQFAADMSDYNKFDNRGGNNRGPKTKPTGQFLRFVVYKENMDTNSAMHQIQRRRGSGGRGGKHEPRLGFAGMKDKRGITSQFVTMPARSSVEGLVRAINPKPTDDQAGGGHTDSAGAAVLRVGNFCFVDHDLRLGRLQGNRFDVVLRNIVNPEGIDRSQTKEILAKAATALGKAGFINYFGVQRFGKFCDTHLVGIAILQKDFAKAVDLILSPKPNERENTKKARVAWQDRFANVASDASEEVRAAAEKSVAKRIGSEFGRFHNNEVAVLRSLSQRPLDYRRALGCITKTMRMMFVHAIQSYLFNHAATFRLQELGSKVVEGDLVADGPIDITDPGIPKVRKVTAEDVEKDQFTLEDVFLPLVGTKTIDPANETSKIYTKLLTEHGLTRSSFDVKDRDLNCAGDYRRMIVRPSDVDYDLIEYTDPRQPLVQTDLMKLQGIPIKTAPESSPDSLLAMRVGFTLPPSAYATIALRELMKRPTSSDYQKDLSLDS